MNARFVVGILIIILGISILFDLNLFKLILPLFLIWIGIQIISGKDMSHHEMKEASEDKIKRVLMFSGINQKIMTENFQGGEIVTVLGGGQIDLSEVKTKEKQITLELVAIMGGLEITIPKNWKVISEGVGILGGFDNQVKASEGKKTTDIYIKGVAVLGGVVIKN